MAFRLPSCHGLPAHHAGFVDATLLAAPHGRRLATWDGTRNPLVSHGWFSHGADAHTQAPNAHRFPNPGHAVAPCTLVHN